MAQKVVEEKLGFGLQNKLAADIYKDIVNIEKFFIDPNEPDIDPNVIKNIYNVFDKIFMHINQNLPTPQKFIDVDQCLKKANEAGFYVNKNKLESLKKINKDRLEKAVENKPISLQASFLVFLFKMDVNGLIKISSKIFNLLIIVNNVAKLRGHGDVLIIKQKDPKLLQTTIKEARDLLYDFTKLAENLNII